MKHRLLLFSLLMLFPLFFNHQKVAPQGALDQTGTLWVPLEWSLNNPTVSGNPYDLVATVTFVHAGSGETRTTEMFHDGGSTWKFRFTGTQTGQWTFTTQSSDPELNGHSGTVTINPQSNPQIKGFLGTQGSKFVIQDHQGNPQAYLFNVFMDEENFRTSGNPHNDTYGDSLLQWENNAESRTLAYLQHARQSGFEVLFLSINNQWFKIGQGYYDNLGTENPDPRTFAVIERIIRTAHENGARVHIWMWGDEQRHWTPIGGPAGGINGVRDQRAQRYIAARLGPLPGWSISYGFDVKEWASESQVAAWANNLKQHMGWQHLIFARGYDDPALSGISYSSNGPGSFEGDVQTSANGPRNYDEVVGHILSAPNRTHFYEERFTYQRTFYGGPPWSMDLTRRSLWWTAIAGGVGSWYGYFDNGPQPYPNQEQLRTHQEFWMGRGRFQMNMQPCNFLTDSMCLWSDNTDFVFYREDTNAVQVNISAAAGPLPAVAVDTRGAYAEIDLGMMEPGNHTWNAPHASDWAVAVGYFGQDAPNNPPEPTAVPTEIPTEAPTLPPDATLPPPTLTQPPTAVTGAAIRFSALPSEALPGEQVAVLVELLNVDGLYGMEVECAVDPQVLTGTSMVGGEGFNNENSFFLDNGYQPDGSWLVAAARMRPQTSISGSMTAFTLLYDVTGTGTTPITCDVLGVDQNGQELSLQIIDGSFSSAATTATDEPPVPTATDEPPAPTATDEPPVPTATDEPPVPTATEDVPPMPPVEATTQPQPTTELPVPTVTEEVIIATPTLTSTPEATLTPDASGLTTITGTITYQGQDDHSTIMVGLVNSAGQIVASGTADADGTYEFASLPPDSYTLYGGAPQHLLMAVPVTTSADNPVVEVEPLVLVAGDVDDNAVIDIADVTFIGANYGVSVPPAPENVDLNRDALVNISDLAIAAGNQGLSGLPMPQIP